MKDFDLGAHKRVQVLDQIEVRYVVRLRGAEIAHACRVHIGLAVHAHDVLNAVAVAVADGERGSERTLAEDAEHALGRELGAYAHHSLFARLRQAEDERGLVRLERVRLIIPGEARVAAEYATTRRLDDDKRALLVVAFVVEGGGREAVARRSIQQCEGVVGRDEAAQLAQVAFAVWRQDERVDRAGTLHRAAVALELDLVRARPEAHRLVADELLEVAALGARYAPLERDTRSLHLHVSLVRRRTTLGISCSWILQRVGCVLASILDILTHSGAKFLVQWWSTRRRRQRANALKERSLACAHLVEQLGVVVVEAATLALALASYRLLHLAEVVVEERAFH